MYFDEKRLTVALLLLSFISVCFLPSAFASSKTRFSEDFDFSLRFDDQEANSYTLDGDVDGEEVINFSLSINFDKFSGDRIDEVDVRVRGDGISEDLDERDEEIITRRNELTIDLEDEAIELRDTVDFDIRVEDEDGDSESIEFTVSFDVDKDEFEIRIREFDEELVRNSVELIVENQSFDAGDGELDIDIKREDEAIISLEGNFEDYDPDKYDRGRTKARGTIRDLLVKKTSGTREKTNPLYVGGTTVSTQTNSLRNYYLNRYAYSYSSPAAYIPLTGFGSTGYHYNYSSLRQPTNYASPSYGGRTYRFY